MNVTIEVNPQRLLETAARMFDGTVKSLLLELLQNGRRAGATKADILIDKEGVLTVNNNGAVIEDFAPMFSLGTTGWEDKNEDPAGAGFFSCLLGTHVSIHSGNKIVTASKEQLTTLGAELEVEQVDTYFPGVSVMVAGISPKALESRSLRGYVVCSLLDNYPMETSLTIEDGSPANNGYDLKYTTPEGSTPYNVRSGEHKYEFPEHNLVVFVSRSAFNGYHNLNYFGHVVPIQSDRRINLGHSIPVETRVLPMDNKKDSGLRMVLPSRNALIENDAVTALVEDVLPKAAAMFLRDSYGDSHGLYYEEWVHITKNLKVAVPEMAEPNWNDTHLICVPLDQAVQSEKAFVDPKHLGYSWSKKVTAYEGLVVRYVNEEDDSYQTICDDSIGVVEFAFKDNDKYTPTDVIDYAYSTPYGSCADYICAVATEAHIKFAGIEDLTEALSNAWEPSDDGDSTDTQRYEFDEALAEVLTETFLGADEALKTAAINGLEHRAIMARQGDVIAVRPGITFEASRMPITSPTAFHKYIKSLDEQQQQAIFKAFSPSYHEVL